jgi:hypothetical protein
MIPGLNFWVQLWTIFGLVNETKNWFKIRQKIVVKKRAFQSKKMLVFDKKKCAE